MLKNELDTPCLVVDYDLVIKNIEAAVEVGKKEGVTVRPHIKTHKTPEIARLQIEKGCQGITVAKPGEAEVMVKAGIKDILVAYPTIGKKKITRLYNLSRMASIKYGVDSMEGARGLSNFAQEKDTVFEVVMIVDTGLKRDGVKPDREGLKLAQKMNKLPGIELKGIFTHEGHADKAPSIEKAGKEAAEALVSFGELLKENGIKIEVISIGATPTLAFGSQIDGVTEMRPGTFVFNDFNLVKSGCVEIEDCALTVYTTVVSKPSPERAIIDAGSKSLTVDRGVPTDNPAYQGHGFIKDLDGAVIDRLSEEHGVIEFSGDDNSAVAIGDRLEVIPNHVCPVVNLFDRLYIIKDEEVVDQWEIKARGKVR